MTPDEAYAALERLVSSPAAPDDIRRAWRDLDAGLRGHAELPVAWARLSSTAAAARAGIDNPNRWRDMVHKGYAPPADGTDDVGRSWWHPATVDAYRRDGWQRVPDQRDPGAPPPLAGPGATSEAWAQWATAHGVTVDASEGRVLIQDACRAAGLIG